MCCAYVFNPLYFDVHEWNPLQPKAFRSFWSVKSLRLFCHLIHTAALKASEVPYQGHQNFKSVCFLVIWFAFGKKRKKNKWLFDFCFWIQTFNSEYKAVFVLSRRDEQNIKDNFKVCLPFQFTKKEITLKQKWKIINLFMFWQKYTLFQTYAFQLRLFFRFICKSPCI